MTSLIHALEVADKTTSIETHLLSGDAEDVVDAILLRLGDTTSTAPTNQAKNRLWRMLAQTGTGEGRIVIIRQDQANELADAYANGDVQTRLAVVQRMHLVDAPVRNALVSTVRSSVPTEDDALVLVGAVDALSALNELSGVSLTYAMSLAADLSVAAAALHDQIFYQSGPAMGQANQRGMSLRTSSLTAALRSRPNLSDAITLASSFPDDDECVATALYRACAFNPALETSSQSQRSTWIAEYTRRFCLPAGSAHREKYSVAFYLYMKDEFADSGDSLCDAYSEILSSLNSASFRGYSAIATLSQNQCE